MISGENIQQYINFLHEKRYNAPANDELLDRWKSLNDFEIIQQLQGLYNFWEIDSMTAAMYERLFLQSNVLHSTELKETTTAEPVEAVKQKNNSGFRYLTIGLIIIAVILGIIWLWARTGKLSETNTELQKRMRQVKDSISQEQAIRMQQEQEVQRQAYEKAQKLKAVKDNIDQFITQKVTYDYDGFFGGIDHVIITVSNNSDFNVNQATVVLLYIKKNGDLYDTKYVTIQEIAAHSQKMINGPDSKRGTKLDSKLGKVVLDEGTVNKVE